MSAAGQAPSSAVRVEVLLFFLRAYSAKDRLARGAVLFSGVLDTSEVIKKTAYPDNADPVVRNAAALDHLKLLRPRLVPTAKMDYAPPSPARSTPLFST